MICVNEEQNSNEPFPIEVTDGGIMNFFNDLHLLNVLSFIDVIDDGIVMLVNFVHSLKAEL